MTWKDRVRTIVNAALEPDQAQSHSVTRLADKRRLSGDDVGGFLEAASHRDNPLFEEMDSLLRELSVKYPFRAAKMRAEIRWMRGQAYKAGLPWGKKASLR